MVEARQDIDFYHAVFFFLGKLTMTDLKVYYALGELGHDTACKAYQHEIAEQAKLDPRQVRRSLARLVSVGLLKRSGGRYRAVYRFTYPKRGDKIDPSHVAEDEGYTKREDNSVPSHVVGDDGYTKREDKIDPSGAVKGDGYTKREDNSVPSDYSTTITTTKKTSTPKNQLVVIQDDHAQNLGALDIAAQENLSLFKIHPHLVQNFRYAPQLIKEYTPAKILMFHDHEGQIAANLARWRHAWDTGQIDLAGLAPALIWCKIVELQEPPLKLPSPESQAISQEVESILTEASKPTVQAGEPSPDELPTALPEKPPISSPQAGPSPESPPGSGAEREEEQLWPETKISLITSRPHIAPLFDESYLANVTRTEICTCYTIAVKDEATATQLNHQYRHNAARTLAALAGQPSHQIEVNFIATPPLIPLPASPH